MDNRLIIATGHGEPGLWHDEVGLPAAFEALGWSVDVQHWRDIKPDGTPIVIRTAWDYTQHAAEFQAFLDRVDESCTPCINDSVTLRWNLDKRYLFELASKGHAIVPTRIAETLDEALELCPDDGIAKPVVGGGAEGLHRLRDGHAIPYIPAGNTWGAAEPNGPFMVQPFMESIHDGEWSLFYFGGQYSHTILKSPADGDIRVQEEHGGTTRPEEPPSFVRAAADAIAADVPRAIQMRVDGIVHDGQFLLMELELIEPELYFRSTVGGEARFAQAIVAALA